MFKVIRNILNSDLQNEAWNLYRNTTNVVEIDGRSVDRHASGMNGVFLLSKYTNEEFKNIWNGIKERIVQEINSDLKLCYSRILKYGPTGYIQKHVDSYAENSQQESDMSIIIQLSSPAKYTGGELIISKQLMDLDVGDLLIYTYEHEHEVKPVKTGIRYVINLRCKMIK